MTICPVAPPPSTQKKSNICSLIELELRVCIMQSPDMVNKLHCIVNMNRHVGSWGELLYFLIETDTKIQPTLTQQTLLMSFCGTTIDKIVNRNRLRYTRMRLCEIWIKSVRSPPILTKTIANINICLHLFTVLPIWNFLQCTQKTLNK